MIKAVGLTLAIIRWLRVRVPSPSPLSLQDGEIFAAVAENGATPSPLAIAVGKKRMSAAFGSTVSISASRRPGRVWSMKIAMRDDYQ
jgi:hypothetical protein